MLPGGLYFSGTRNSLNRIDPHFVIEKGFFCATKRDDLSVWKPTSNRFHRNSVTFFHSYLRKLVPGHSKVTKIIRHFQHYMIFRRLFGLSNAGRRGHRRAHLEISDGVEDELGPHRKNPSRVIGYDEIQPKTHHK